MGDTESPTNQQTAKIRTYVSRFWILGLFSFLAWFQCLQWNLWGSLSESVEAAYPTWDYGTIATMANYGALTFALFVVPMVWFMNTRGLRVGVLLCAALVAAGTLVKLISFTSDSQTLFTAMCTIGAILNGIPGTLIMSAPPMIAAVWFPPQERTTATAVAQVMNQMGSAGSYLQPLLVRAPSDDVTQDQIKADIRRLLYIYGGIGTAVLLAVVVYFPATPPMPPSRSSYNTRFDFKKSTREIIRNRDLVLVMLSYSIFYAIPACWMTVLNYSLADLGMHQDEAMWVGLSAVLAGGVTGLVTGRMTDLVYGHVKISLLVLMILSLASFYWFHLLSSGAITVTTWQIFCSVCGGLAFNAATTPLFFELAVELGYPCPEVVIGGFLTGVMNVVGLCFLLIFLIPNIGYQWVTYVLLASSVCSLVPLLLVREDYSRSHIDRDPSNNAPSSRTNSRNISLSTSQTWAGL